MKKFIAVVLSVLLTAVTFVVPCFADETGEANHLTHKWNATFFPGQLTEKEEDGATVTTYVPQIPEATWFSPQLSVFEDLKKIAEGNESVEFYFHIELRGVFTGSADSANIGFLFRGVDPRNNSYAYPVEELENWDGQGRDWMTLYDEALGESDLIFKTDFGGNVMSILSPTVITVTDDWTVFESDPITVSPSSLSDDLFGDLVLCMDFAQCNGFTGGFKGIQIKNSAIYVNSAQSPATEAPTEEPEPEQTGIPEDPTEAPDPAETATGAVPAEATGNASEGDNGNENEKKNAGVNPGVIAGIVIGVLAAAGIIAAVIVAGKKKKRG